MLTTLLLVIGLAASGAGELGASPGMQKYAHLPRDVRAFIERRVECNHFAGEDRYDSERASQVDAALRELRCDRLEADELALRRKHAHAPAVLRALTETRDDTL